MKPLTALSVILALSLCFTSGCVGERFYNLTEKERREALRLYAPNLEGVMLWSDLSGAETTGRIIARVLVGILCFGLSEAVQGSESRRAYNQYLMKKQEVLYEMYLQEFVDRSTQDVLKAFGVPDREFSMNNTTVWIYYSIERTPTTLNSVSFGSGSATAYSGLGNSVNAYGTSTVSTYGTVYHGAVIEHQVEFTFDADKKCVNVRRRKISR